ncbi:MAG: hypothetical protein AAGB48_08680, partial [Planctomycetota bacterium]
SSLPRAVSSTAFGERREPLRNGLTRSIVPSSYREQTIAISPTANDWYSASLHAGDPGDVE